MTRLWERSAPIDETLLRLTVGRDPELDQRLLAHDCLASAAHAEMLTAIGVLDADELAALEGELAAIATEARAGEIVIDRELEDGHTYLENRLTERLGDAGRRIHTGRSRNDQVIAALRLWGREALLAQLAGVLAVATRLDELATAHREVTLPGTTHTRQAMSTTLGHYFGAWAENVLDDVPWLQAAYRHLDRSPLGSASGFGVALPLERERVARTLGFGELQENTLAVQNDRGKSEALALAAAAAVATDCGRLATDLIVYSSDELGYLRLPDALTTGSSIMPQKRNPDLLELVRAGAARVRGRQAEIGGVYGPLGAGYHRDLQLTKEPFLEGMQTTIDLLAAVELALAGLTVDAERCRAALSETIGATDAVYRAVADGTPFREAYKRAAADPQAAAAAVGAESWRERRHTGAPGAAASDSTRRRLADGREWLGERTAAIERATSRLAR